MGMSLKQLGAQAAQGIKQGKQTRRGRVPDDLYLCRLTGCTLRPGEGKDEPRSVDGVIRGRLTFTLAFAIMEGVDSGERYKNRPLYVSTNLLWWDERAGGYSNIGRASDTVEALGSYFEAPDEVLCTEDGEFDPEEGQAFAVFEEVARNLRGVEVEGVRVRASTRSGSQYQNYELLPSTGEGPQVKGGSAGAQDPQEEEPQEQADPQANGQYEEGQEVEAKRAGKWKPATFVRLRPDNQLSVRLDGSKGTISLDPSDVRPLK